MGATTLSAPATATYPQKYAGRFGPSGSSVYTARSTVDGKTEVTFVLAGSTSYATGGDSISLDGLPINRVEQAYVVSDSAVTAPSGLADGYAPVFDLTDTAAPKLVLYTSAGQVANTTNVSSREYLVKFVGR
jgi:hypothetical protein